DPTPLRPLREHGIPDHLVKLIEQMMHKQPQARPSGFVEVAERLDPRAAVRPVAAGRQWALAWGFAPVALLIAGASGWLWMQRHESPATPPPVEQQPPAAAVVDRETQPVELIVETPRPAESKRETPPVVDPPPTPSRQSPTRVSKPAPAAVAPTPAAAPPRVEVAQSSPPPP